MSRRVIGIMSRATKRKHVTKEVMEDLVEPTDAQEIVKVMMPYYCE